jgi:hypothetical protein
VNDDGQGGVDTIATIENIQGSDFDDNITGDINANEISGNIGSDTLYGGDGDDVLYGLGEGAFVSTTLMNENFAGGLGAFTFTGQGTYFTNGLDVNDNDGNNSININAGRSGGSGGATYTNTGGSYSASITFASDTENVELSLFYNIITTNLDPGEIPNLNVYWNGVSVFSDSVNPNGGTVDSGWLSTGILSLGSVAAGTYTLSLEGIQSSMNKAEFADFYFDQVLVTGDVASASGDLGSTNILAGQGGADTLYGSDGMDIFVFESATAFGALDSVYSYTTADGDALDISDILTVAGYQDGVDVLTDWVQITDDGVDSTLRVDTTGTATFGAGTEVATIFGRVGLTDEVALETGGNLIVV